MAQQTLDSLFSLAGRTGIVTGGSGGLGLAIARLLAEAGATVHAFSRTGHLKSPADGRDLVAGLHHHTVDVTRSADLAAVVERIGEEEGLDFVVHAAGVTEKRPFGESSMADWDRVQAVNVRAAAELARLTYPLLKKSTLPGRLIFVTSMAAHLGFEGVASYGASKAALLGLMRGLAVEWAADGVLVNSVAPGWFPTDMTAQVMDESRRQKILSRMPLHRFGRAEELAPAVLYLVSPAASYVTGHDLAVDGGALAFGF